MARRCCLYKYRSAEQNPAGPPNTYFVICSSGTDCPPMTTAGADLQSWWITEDCSECVVPAGLPVPAPPARPTPPCPTGPHEPVEPHRPTQPVRPLPPQPLNWSDEVSDDDPCQPVRQREDGKATGRVVCKGKCPGKRQTCGRIEARALGTDDPWKPAGGGFVAEASYNSNLEYRCVCYRR